MLRATKGATSSCLLTAIYSRYWVFHMVNLFWCKVLEKIMIRYGLWANLLQRWQASASKQKTILKLRILQSESDFLEWVMHGNTDNCQPCE